MTSRFVRILIVILFIFVSFTIYLLSDEINRLQSLGYIGAFVIMLIGNATIILPAPGLALIFALGSSLDPVLVGLSAGLGAALGELTGYLAGASGRSAIEKRPMYQRFERFMIRVGPIAVVALAAIPNPAFDIVGIIAGALNFNWKRFLVLAWIGKTIQGISIAFAGSVSASWILPYL